MVTIVLILSLAALVVTKGMDFFTTVRHVGSAAEQNPVARVLFDRWGFGGGLFVVGLIWTAIVVITYGTAFRSESELIKLATAAVGFFVAWAQWSAARFNSTGHRSWVVQVALKTYRRLTIWISRNPRGDA